MNAVQQRGSAIIRRLPKGAKVAEVGVLIGKLSELLLSARQDIDLLMIDNWAPADKQPDSYRATGDVHAGHDAGRVAQHLSQAQNRARHFADRAHIMHMDSLDAAKLVADHSLDLVFLDADHSYEGVKADLEAWTPKIKYPHGWIGGHDYQNPEAGYDFSGVERAVNEWADGRKIELDWNYTWFCRPW